MSKCKVPRRIWIERSGDLAHGYPCGYANNTTSATGIEYVLKGSETRVVCRSIRKALQKMWRENQGLKWVNLLEVDAELKRIGGG